MLDAQIILIGILLLVIGMLSWKLLMRSGAQGLQTRHRLMCGGLWAGDVLVRYWLPFSLAVCMTVLYYGQYWILANVSRESAPRPFLDWRFLANSDLVVLLSLMLVGASVAYCAPLTKGVSRFLSLFKGGEKEAKGRYWKEAIAGSMAIGIVVASLHQGWAKFFSQVGENLIMSVVAGLVSAVLAFIAANILLSKGDEISENRTHANLLNCMLGVGLFGVLSLFYWHHSSTFIATQAPQLPPVLQSHLHRVLMTDVVRLGLLATIAILPIVRFRSMSPQNLVGYRVGFAILFSLLGMAWLALLMGDEVYKMKIQMQTGVYSAQFPHDWQKGLVEQWVSFREGLLVSMIVVTLWWTSIELLGWSNSMYVKRLDGSPATEDDIAALIEAIDCAGSKRGWPIFISRGSAKPHDRASGDSAGEQPPSTDGLLTIGASKRRTQLLLRRIARDEGISLGRTDNVVVIFDSGILSINNGKRSWIESDVSVAQYKHSP